MMVFWYALIFVWFGRHGYFTIPTAQTDYPLKTILLVVTFIDDSMTTVNRRNCNCDRYVCTRIHKSLKRPFLYADKNFNAFKNPSFLHWRKVFVPQKFQNSIDR